MDLNAELALGSSTGFVSRFLPFPSMLPLCNDFLGAGSGACLHFQSANTNQMLSMKSAVPKVWKGSVTRSKAAQFSQCE